MISKTNKKILVAGGSGFLGKRVVKKLKEMNIDFRSVSLHNGVEFRNFKTTKDFKEDKWWDGPLHESVLVYGFVRKASWVQSWAYYKQHGFKTINLILPNMYGPGDHFDETRSHALGALI